MGMDIFFGDCICPRFVRNPEFHDLMCMEKGSWPLCLSWHGSLTILSGVDGGSPRVRSVAAGARNLLEFAVETYSSNIFLDWNVLDDFAA